MAFNWDEYLSVAYVVASDAHPKKPVEVCASLKGEVAEARYRAAISRAYYAALGMCREHILENSSYQITNTSSDHTLIKKYFIPDKSMDKQLQNLYKEMGEAIAELNEVRNVADYYLNVNMGKNPKYAKYAKVSWKKMAENALSNAEIVCQGVVYLEAMNA